MDLASEGVPLLSIDWVRKTTLASDEEIAVALHLGLIEPERGAPASSSAHSDLLNDVVAGQAVADKYFLLLLVNLYERWFELDAPYTALENLVLYFKDSNSIYIGDGMLPSGIAGISETSTRRARDTPTYLNRMARHEWLGKYVRASLIHDAFRAHGLGASWRKKTPSPSGQSVDNAPPRIRELLIAAKKDRDPWDPLPESGIAAVAGRCGAAEIAEAIAELDTLSAERAEVEDWDGDTMADISKAQEPYARILGTVADDLLPDIAAGFGSAWPTTRHWIAIALARHGEAAFPVLREALDTETDAGVREFIEAAVVRMGG